MAGFLDRRVSSWFSLLGAGFVAGALGPNSVAAQPDNFERPPISYRTAAEDNPVARLQARWNAGPPAVRFDDRVGYLADVLTALEIPLSSQTLVFTKTSVQRHRIGPRTPRAIYFNDDVYVGFSQRGDMLEFSAADPNLGTVFYTLAQNPEAPPRFERQLDSCLICHGSSPTYHVPGHLVRSMYADFGGQPVLASGTYRTDHTSPLAERWGGWYVTGHHAQHTHLGNLVVQGRVPPGGVPNPEGMNLLDLKERFNVGKYLTPHSDLVALLVLNHQAEGHNLLVRASFHTRQALAVEQGLNRETGQPETHRWPSTTTRIEAAGEPLVKYLLFCEEAKLAGPLRGTSNFAAEFTARGPRDAQGRSLREFDLQTRMFRYPLSYLIYSKSFEKLPPEMRDYVWRRLADILFERDNTAPFAHLTAADRRAIREIVRATIPNLPAGWTSVD